MVQIHNFMVMVAGFILGVFPQCPQGFTEPQPFEMFRKHGCDHPTRTWSLEVEATGITPRTFVPCSQVLGWSPCPLTACRGRQRRSRPRQQTMARQVLDVKLQTKGRKIPRIELAGPEGHGAPPADERA